MEEKKNLIAQWAFDTRPVLARFHLWLEDVEVERGQAKPVSSYTFAPRGMARCLAMTSAVTALGTKLFGRFGKGAGGDKATINRVKKAADAISAYVMSEGLWHFTRNLPENHAIMVCLGEGLMPKAGETPEMGANPLLGFGRVYGRPEVAKFVDAQVRRLLNEPGRTFDDFYAAMNHRGITIWGAAVDTLENTSRFAKGKDTGPMSVLHLFDQPLTMTRPYEAYMGSLTVPGPVRATAQASSVLLDYMTPRDRVLEAIEQTYPGIKREHVHVWTLRGKSREKRLGKLWQDWSALGVHLVEDDWQTPTGIDCFTDSGTYAPTFMVGDWKDESGSPHVFICDGYAATAEAMQAASLSEVLDVDVSMASFSPKFNLSYDDEYQLMRLSPEDPDFGRKVGKLFGSQPDDAEVEYYRSAIRDAVESNMLTPNRSLYAEDFFPEKHWRVLACVGHMCPDPYTGAEGVEDLGDNRYRVTARLATRKASAKITFVFRLEETFDQSRLVFNPLLERFMMGEDYTSRPVKVSDSGRIRNELQTLISQTLEYDGDIIRVHLDKLNEKVMSEERQRAIRTILTWYKDNHPAWFEWLEIA